MSENDKREVRKYQNGRNLRQVGYVYITINYLKNQVQFGYHHGSLGILTVTLEPDFGEIIFLPETVRKLSKKIFQDVCIFLQR